MEVKFDPDTLVAFKIDTEEEEAEIEGVIVGIQGGEATIETEHGRRLALVVNDHTAIKLKGDLPGTIADLHINTKIEAKFDPSTRVAIKIEARGSEQEDKKTN